VDDAHETIRIYEVVFRPSEVLFQMEPESHRVYLAEHDDGAQDTEATPRRVEPAEPLP
jgi:hypothetical protein